MTVAVEVVHEMGHFLVARRRSVQVTLPYFIPAPFFLGTFGAFIRMSSRVRDRATFFDVAVAGPLTGLVAALAALVLGLAFGSTAMGHGMNPRSSTLVYVVYRLTGGDPGASLVELGAVAFAGWLGIVITALNLIPVGQLDGGHIAYALLGGRRAATVGAVLLGLLVAGGLFYSPHLLMWAVLVWAIAGLRHPPAQNEFAPLGAARTARIRDARAPGRDRAPMAGLNPESPRARLPRVPPQQRSIGCRPNGSSAEPFQRDAHASTDDPDS